MTSLGGVKPENATYLPEPSRAALYAAHDKAKAEAQKHSPDEVTLLFYFSGHGDHDAIHLGGERVLISEVTRKLAEIPAGLRIAVTDACRSTRTKGFATDEPFAISTAVSPQAAGQVWLHASSDGEAAQESDEIQGAIFTNAWLSGLRGAADSNGDARVTLDESFAFAHAQTLIRSSKSSVSCRSQRPSSTCARLRQSSSRRLRCGWERSRCRRPRTHTFWSTPRAARACCPSLEHAEPSVAVECAARSLRRAAPLRWYRRDCDACGGRRRGATRRRARLWIGVLRQESQAQAIPSVVGALTLGARL